jgi:hypothetical protein
MLLRLRDHDVQPAYIRQLQALGYQGLSAQELVDLRDHDVQPERIQRANASAGRRLTAGDLNALASRGWR